MDPESVRSPKKARPALGEDTDPQWSPDGRQLMFQRNNVRAAIPQDGIALWTITLATGCEKRITPWDLRAGDTPRASAKSVSCCVAGISAGQQQCDRVFGVPGVVP